MFLIKQHYLTRDVVDLPAVVMLSSTAAAGTAATALACHIQQPTGH